MPGQIVLAAVPDNARSPRIDVAIRIALAFKLAMTRAAVKAGCDCKHRVVHP